MQNKGGREGGDKIRKKILNAEKADELREEVNENTRLRRGETHFPGKALGEQTDGLQLGGKLPVRFDADHD
ncbi:hypothetical protein [Chelativorans sp. YIM 93263]|uniref:hypothetical protein n=1 Tax=Chelativorans sp. YIM 93263 TaxID=2906648 RepID=UPI0023792828|nr:hypothetical protein [Chelativorans sp. YIM 93263]